MTRFRVGSTVKLTFPALCHDFAVGAIHVDDARGPADCRSSQGRQEMYSTALYEYSNYSTSIREKAVKLFTSILGFLAFGLCAGGGP